MHWWHLALDMAMCACAGLATGFWLELRRVRCERDFLRAELGRSTATYHKLEIIARHMRKDGAN